MINSNIRQNIELLQWYYRYLYLWKFLEQIIKDNDFSQYSTDTLINTWEKTSFLLRWDFIEKTLSDIHQHADKKNIFWYLTEINAFKWIFTVMREMIDSNKHFQLFLKKKLWEKYFDFDQIIRFSRNVLNHTINSGLKLKEEDFKIQKDYLKQKGKYTLDFEFKYADHFKERDPKSKYWMNIHVNLYKIRHNKSFFQIIPLHELYLLSELCFNITEIYRLTKKK